jgi:hypothetical protein
LPLPSALRCCSAGLRFFDLSAVPQLLVCLRTLIRRCVYENVPVPKLFPEEVSPELQKLLTLLLLKFQPEWLEDTSKDQVVVQWPATMIRCVDDLLSFPVVILIMFCSFFKR